jgi:hypothetical protein
MFGFVLMVVGNANATMMSTDFRVNSDYSNVNGLTGYDAVQQSGTLATPWGDIKFEDGTSVPSGWIVWFLDDGTKPSGWDSGTPFLTGMQPVGVFSTDNSGTYAIETTSAIRGDVIATNTVDEGVRNGTFLTLVAEDMSTNKFFHARFTNGNLLTDGYWPLEYGWNDILIDRSAPIVPEPASITLFLLGGLALNSLHKRKAIKDE